MSKKIRHVDELPEWFDIRPYEQWEDEEPGTAVNAVWGHLLFLKAVASLINGSSILDDEARQAGLDELKESAATPYQDRGIGWLHSVYECVERRIFGEESASKKEADIEARVRRMCCASDAAQEIIGESLPMDDGIAHVTLADVMAWMKENRPLIEALEAKAADLASANDWEFDDVLNSMFQEVPLWNWEGSPFIIASGSPSIKAEAQAIERYLTKHRNKEDVLTGKPSEVRKLFDYRFAAYADLKSWSYLTGNTISNKCMACALFPEGPYESLDMTPTKTLGGFYKRLVEDEGYIDSLVRQAAEMKSLQN